MAELVDETAGHCPRQRTWGAEVSILLYRFWKLVNARLHGWRLPLIIESLGEHIRRVLDVLRPAFRSDPHRRAQCWIWGVAFATFLR